jgi:hypothetical protein
LQTIQLVRPGTSANWPRTVQHFLEIWKFKPQKKPLREVAFFMI